MPSKRVAVREAGLRILIVRLSSIGDVVRVIPALESLRAGLPDAMIDWVVSYPAGELIEGHPAVNEVIRWRNPRGKFQQAMALWRNCRQIRRKHYDVVLDFHATDLRAALMVGSSGAESRFGFPAWRCREGSHLFTNCKVQLPQRRMNRIDEFLELSSPLTSVRSTSATIAVPAEIRESVDRFIRENLSASRPVVAMHVPVEDRHKQWPDQEFAKLADLLLAEGQVRVLLTWGPGQRAAIERVLALMKHIPQLAPEPHSLKAYAWLVRSTDLYVGPDTGPMHIASAMGVPVVALFGGSDPVAHGPYRKPYQILFFPWIDPRAARRVPLRANRGLNMISARVAFEACMRILAARK